MKANLKGRYVQYYLDQTTTLNKNYFVLDGRVGYEFTIYLLHRGEVFLNLSNAFDKEYEVVEGYPMPPRALSAGSEVLVLNSGHRGPRKQSSVQRSAKEE